MQMSVRQFNRGEKHKTLLQRWLFTFVSIWTGHINANANSRKSPQSCKIQMTKEKKIQKRMDVLFPKNPPLVPTFSVGHCEGKSHMRERWKQLGGIGMWRVSPYRGLRAELKLIRKINLTCADYRLDYLSL